MRADDAALAVEHGVEGIVGLQPRRPAARPCAVDDRGAAAIAEAVDGRAEIYLDSGVRRGTDIIKALALGARAVLVGRPLVYGLGAAGRGGRQPRLRVAARRARHRDGAGGLPEGVGDRAGRGYVKSPSSGCQFGTPEGRSAYCRSAASSGRLGCSGVVGERRRVGAGGVLLGSVGRHHRTNLERRTGGSGSVLPTTPRAGGANPAPPLDSLSRAQSLRLRAFSTGGPATRLAPRGREDSVRRNRLSIRWTSAMGGAGRAGVMGLFVSGMRLRA